MGVAEKSEDEDRPNIDYLAAMRAAVDAVLADRGNSLMFSTAQGLGKSGYIQRALENRGVQVIQLKPYAQ